MKKGSLLQIHSYLHNKAVDHCTYNGLRVDFKFNTLGHRYCEIDGVKFIEQNPTKDTEYSRMAAAGTPITWGIRPGQWDLIVGNEIVRCNESIVD